MCFDFLYNVCLKTFLILKRPEREMIIGLRVQHWLIVVRC